jgi:hypothetical protein
MFDRSIQATIFAAVCAGLVACGDKPPDCAEAKVLDRLREAIPQDAVKRITDNIEAAGNWKRPGAQQLRALLDEFGRGIKVEFKDIATDGADPTAKRSSCSVAINVNTVEGLASSQRVTYTVQRTVDSKEFLLNVPGYEFLLGAIGGSFDVHVEKARASAAAPCAHCYGNRCCRTCNLGGCPQPHLRRLKDGRLAQGLRQTPRGTHR